MSDETEVAEIETKAREMGWVPKEEFKGAEDKWIPADQFVERGEHLLPILHATNKRLKNDVETMKGQLNEVTEALRVSRETISALETYHEEDVKRKVESARKNLKEELRAASERGDHEAVADLTEELTNLKSAEKADTERRDDEVRRPIQDPTKAPEFIAWKNDNSWYGTDHVKTGIANAMTWKLRQEGNRDVGRAFLDAVTKATEAEILKLSGGRPAPAKVESGGPSGSGGNSSKGKTFSDLPADAKEACRSFEKTLVGPNRRYKTADEWHKKYAADYFAGN